MPKTGDNFQELLCQQAELQKQLATEHERVVSGLRSEIVRLEGLAKTEHSDSSELEDADKFNEDKLSEMSINEIKGPPGCPAMNGKAKEEAFDRNFLPVLPISRQESTSKGDAKPQTPQASAGCWNEPPVVPSSNSEKDNNGKGPCLAVLPTEEATKEQEKDADESSDSDEESSADSSTCASMFGSIRNDKMGHAKTDSFLNARNSNLLKKGMRSNTDGWKSDREVSPPARTSRLGMPGRPSTPPARSASMEDRAIRRKSVTASPTGSGLGGSPRELIRRQSLKMVGVNSLQALTSAAGGRRPSNISCLGDLITEEVMSMRKPKQFELYPTWLGILHGEQRISNLFRGVTGLSTHTGNSILSDAKLNELRWDFIHRWLVIHPSSLKLLAWTLLGLVVIVYDLLVTPLRVFDLPDLYAMVFIQQAILVYWILDFFISFLVGYHTASRIELNITTTAYRYAYTWMLFDLALLLLDLLTVLEYPRLARAVRINKGMQIISSVRSLRLLRVMKMPSALKTFTILVVQSEYTRLTWGIFRHFSVIFMVNHLVACAWYALGIAQPNGWVERYLPPNEHLGMLYFTSLHWSLTQFTPATMSVQPNNYHERVFAVLTILFAMITFSSFVSSITNLMTTLWNVRSLEANKLSKLERYFYDKSISFQLCVRVRKYLEHVLDEQRHHVEETDVELLQMLSTPLRMELHFEIHSQLLANHHFFRHLCISNLPIMHKICDSSLKPILLSAGDVLFSSGDAATAMYFVQVGELHYQKEMRKGSFNPETPAETVHSGQWFCEAALWTPWTHRGEMRATTEAKLLAVDVIEFHEVLSKRSYLSVGPAQYAAEAVQKLNEMVQDSMLKLKISDLDIHMFDSEKMAKEAFCVDDSDSDEPTGIIDGLKKKVMFQLPKRESRRARFSTTSNTSGHRLSKLSKVSGSSDSS